MTDWKKILIPLAITAFLTVTAAVYGIAILPRIARNERGIDTAIELLWELKDDVGEIKADLRAHEARTNGQGSHPTN